MEELETMFICITFRFFCQYLWFESYAMHFHVENHTLMIEVTLQYTAQALVWWYKSCINSCYSMGCVDFPLTQICCFPSLDNGRCLKIWKALSLKYCGGWVTKATYSYSTLTCLAGPCKVGNEVHIDGALWSPVACTQCQCFDGRSLCYVVQCPQLTCPANHTLEIQQGSCCPKCVGLQCAFEGKVFKVSL